MTSPSRRRALALTGTALLSLAGCLGERPAGTDPETESTEESRTDPPEYDCSTVDRPDPDPPDEGAEDAVEPTAYPTRPDSLADEDEVAEYVEEYERAYRRNALVEEWGDDLTEQSTWVEDVRTDDAPEGTAVARVEYTYSETVEQPSGTEMIGDSPTVFASYYVDESVVVRAEDTGPRDDEDALDPDPWETGEPVECFA